MRTNLKFAIPNLRSPSSHADQDQGEKVVRKLLLSNAMSLALSCPVAADERQDVEA
jgi:hypothetical protein